MRDGQVALAQFFTAGANAATVEGTQAPQAVATAELSSNAEHGQVIARKTRITIISKVH